jgi:TPR repeat protein
VISNAVIVKVDASKLSYRYSVGVGGGIVRLADLPEDLQARFGYIPDRADNVAALPRPAQQAEAARKKFEEIKAKAEKGDAKAQCSLGVCYHDGDGVTKDTVEAVKWYQKAAEQGLAPAQTNLGVCYQDGVGVTRDALEAVKWFRKAAEQGLAPAQTNLGQCYCDGDGVAKDAVEAAKWIRKAAEQR